MVSRFWKLSVIATVVALLLAQAVGAAPVGVALARGAMVGPAGGPSDPYLITGPAYRIAVEVDGMYRLDHDYLRDAGLPVDDPEKLDPRTFRLFYMYQEVPIQVVGEEDGSFDPPDPSDPGDPGDLVLFYGRGVDSLFHDGALSTNKYTAATVFWLTYSPKGGAPGLRMAARDGAPSGTPESSFLNSLRWEENKTYWPQLPFEPNADHWYEELPIKTSILKPTNKADYSFQLNNAATGTGPGTLSVSILGYKEGPHYLRLYVNSKKVLDGSPGWTDFAVFTATVDVSQAPLLDGANTVRVELVNTGGKNTDTIYVDWFKLSYHDKYVAENDRLDFSNDAAGTWQYKISGYTSNAIEVYDVTEMGAVQRITGGEVTGAGTAYTISFGDTATASASLLAPAGTAPRRYLALTAAAFLTPVSIQYVTRPSSIYTPADLLAPNLTANYILITHSAFWTEALRLADHRAKDYEVALVDVQQIYDQFNGGMMSAEAIRDFLAHVYANWAPAPPAPRYVLLLGDGTSDMRGYLWDSPTFIPPYLDLVDPYRGETAADNRFVMLEGDDNMPEMRIGRLPANVNLVDNTIYEARDMVDKILAYEATTLNGSQCVCSMAEQNKLLFVTDNIGGGGGDFYAYSDQIADGFADPPTNAVPLVPTSFTKTKHYLGRTCDPAADCRAKITATLNERKTLLVSFVGHGNATSWADEGLMNESMLPDMQNGPCLPIMLPMTCLEGAFQEPAPSTALPVIGETIVRWPVNGAVASWSPTGLGLVSGHDYLERGFMLALFHNNARRLGDAVWEGKQYLFLDADAYASHSDLLDTYGLLGDPGLKIHLTADECAIPNAVEIVDFTAQPEASQVRLRWETANELDIVGFRVLRAPAAPPAVEPAANDYVVINEALIPATQAGAVTGGSYSYLDAEVAAGSTYRYRLESLGIDGSITRHQTVEVATPQRWRPLHWLFDPHP